MKTSRIISTGFAMFAMLFGAGNVLYPLALGRDIGSQLWFGLLGFCVTAVLVPLVGLVSVMLSDGDYRSFLNRLGKGPGFLVILVCMGLIGPFGIIPRCVVTAHAAVKLYLPAFNLPLFSLAMVPLLFFSAVKHGRVVDVLGKYLGPLKLIFLLGIVLIGLLHPAPFINVDFSSVQGFVRGLNEGYGTCDLIGIVFFSGLILASLRRGLKPDEKLEPKELAILGFKSGLIGALLLSLVYAGFCIVAAFYGTRLAGVADGDVFAVLTAMILGSAGGLIPNLAVALSCLTTALALSVVFATYVQKELSLGRLSYPLSLLITVCITALMANLGFSGIMGFLFPIITLIYPSLIVLALTNIVQKLFNVDFIKIGVAVTFAISLFCRYWI